jgi:hypothetical protein
VTTQSIRSIRKGRRISGRAQLDQATDPYEAHLKPREPTVCGNCRAVYHLGRWQWVTHPPEAAEDLCPACRRIRDKSPAGVLTLHGMPPGERTNAIIALLRHQEQAEREDHPLNRIMEITQSSGNVVVTTTDIHLPRRLGEAVKQVLHGKLDIRFADTDYFVRADWRPGAEP